MIAFILLVILGMIIAGIWLVYYEERLMDMTQWEPEEFESEVKVRELKSRIKQANESIGRVLTPAPRKPIKRPLYKGLTS